MYSVGIVLCSLIPHNEYGQSRRVAQRPHRSMALHFRVPHASGRHEKGSDSACPQSRAHLEYPRRSSSRLPEDRALPVNGCYRKVAFRPDQVAGSRLVGSHRSEGLRGERRRRAAHMYCVVLLIKHIIALGSPASPGSKRPHGSILRELRTTRLCCGVPAGLSAHALQSPIQSLCLPCFALSRILSRVRRRWGIRSKWDAATTTDLVRDRRHSAGSLGNRRRFGFDG